MYRETFYGRHTAQHQLQWKLILIFMITWAMTWQNQQNECVPSEDSDQPGHLPSLIRVFAVRMKKPRALSYPMSAQQRLWSDWADAQADLSLRWAHMSFFWFCHEVAHILTTAVMYIFTPLTIDHLVQREVPGAWCTLYPVPIHGQGVVYWCLRHGGCVRVLLRLYKSMTQLIRWRTWTK